MEDYNDYPDYNQNTYSQAPKSNKKIWLLILIPILIIVIILVVFLFIRLSSRTISESEFSQGTKFELKEKKEIKFILDEEEHTIKVNSINGDLVNLIIQSNPIQVDIKVGEEKKFDLNNDDFYDIIIKLNKITEGIPELYIKKIYENICTENWGCTNWNSCSQQGQQTRNCTDLNSCDTDKNKPPITRSCTENCVEDWNCGNWTITSSLNLSLNSGGDYSCIKIRNCTDLNNCGTEDNKPEEERSCEDTENYRLFIEQSFPNCVPYANATSSLEGFQIKYYYEVIGKENSLCLVKSTFIENSMNAAYVGKWMTCKLNNSKEFQIAVQNAWGETNNCVGELWDLMFPVSEDSECQNNADCINSLYGNFCDRLNGVCSECLDNNDCSEGEECFVSGPINNKMRKICGIFPV